MVTTGAFISLWVVLRALVCWWKTLTGFIGCALVKRNSLLVILIALFLSGCSQHFARDFVAQRMVTFNQAYASPWLLASEDTDMMCGMGEGLSAMTFPMGPKVDLMIPMLSLASSTCAERKGLEEELRYIRAMRANDVETAQDARTMQKRWMSLSAQRQYFGYKAGVRAFGEPGGACPELESRGENMSYMMTMLLGMQAARTDLSLGDGKVPTDILRKVIRGLGCLDSDEYWGIPNGVQAMGKILLANAGGNQEELTAGFKALDEAVSVGEQQGVRMVQALKISLLTILDREEEAKEAIRNHAQSRQELPPSAEFKLLDEVASRNVKLISDKLWTEATGSRTPYGKLGTFWDDKPDLDEALDVDDLL